MIKNNSKSSQFIFLILVLSFISFNYLNDQLKKPTIKIAKQDEVITLNTKMFWPVNIGLNRMYSSLLWSMTLMESDITHYKKQDLHSWMYVRFLNIVNLDPKFYMAYLIGGKYLSIIKDDLLGAEDIYIRGLRHFPNDFWLMQNAGFNYIYEMGELEKGLKLYDQIKFHPMAKKNFPLLPSIVAKLKREQGIELAEIYDLIKMSYEQEEIPEIKERLNNSLYAIKAEIDLNCLNNNGNNCNLTDQNRVPYLKLKDGTFKSQINWKPFKLSKKILKKIKNLEPSV